MPKDTIHTTIEFKEVDMEALEDLFKPATALMIAVMQAVEEFPDEKVSYFNLIARAALNPPDQFADRVNDFAELFGIIGGIFRMAAEESLDSEDMQPTLAKIAQELEEADQKPEEAAPEPPEFLN